MARAKKPTLIDRWLATATSRGMTTHPPARKAGKRLWSLLEADLAPVRTSAAFALAQLRDPALVQAFILALKGASSKRLAKAVITLGEAGYVNASYPISRRASPGTTCAPSMRRITTFRAIKSRSASTRWSG